ncbi:MAG: hypothetical protein IKG51_02320 [Firmicutes bacterium]|nr:hypothetical protein [Bacillota bacterium]
MNFDEFVTQVKDRVKDFLPEDFADASVEVMETRKLNQTYMALVVRKEGQPIAPSIDLNALYEELENSSMEEVLEEAADLAQRQPEDLDVETIQDYEKAKDRLFIRVSGMEENRELLEEVPYTEFNGLAITYHVLAEINDQEMGSTLVTNALLEKFGVTKEQLHEDALLNSPSILPPSIEPMEAMIGKMMGFGAAMEAPAGFKEQIEKLDMRREGMAVLTNTQMLNGAAVIFYPGVMEKIGDSQQVNFFILPSSVHEVILVNDDGSMNLKDLEEMVKSINASEVAPKDRLSDTVFHYDCKERLLEKASDYESRVNSEIADGAEAPKAKNKKEKAYER